MERYTRYNIAVTLLGGLGSWLCGYTLAAIITTVGQPTFYASLNLDPIPGTTGYKHNDDFIAVVQAVFLVGGFLGCLSSGILSATYGRIRGLQIGAAVAIVGGAIQTGAVNQAMYHIGRFITGLSAGYALAAVPVYLSEVAPPHSRGLLAGAHGCFLNTGYAFANWIGFATFHATSSFAWRFQNAVIIILAIAFTLGTFFMPESPRWLVSKDRRDEALRILCRLHHDPNDPEDIFARKELGLIYEQVLEDNKALKSGGKWQIFTEKTYRKRVIFSAMAIMGSVNTGILAIANYNVLFYHSLGLSNSQGLMVAAGWNTAGALGNFVGATFSDRLGRRKLLLFGFTSVLINLCISTAVIARYTVTGSKDLAAVALVFLFFYGTLYATFIDVNVWTVATEIFPSHLRSQGSAIGISTFMLVNILWLMLAPTATATIGWKYYLVFIALTVAHIIYFWFYLPETSGLALEEIDILFGKQPVNRLTDVTLGSEVAKDEAFHMEAVSAPQEKNFRVADQPVTSQ